MREQVVVNAEKDPNYSPYCLRCSTMRRMRKLAHLYWTCADNCGAIADYREYDSNRPTTPTQGSE